MTGLPVACIELSDVSAFGAAKIARSLVDRQRDFAELARQWSPASRVVQPGADAPVYREVLKDYLAPFARAQPIAS